MESIVKDRQRVLVRQVKEWGEILLGFEARNRFEIVSDDGEVLALAAEEGGGFGRVLLRNLFGRWRAATIHVLSPDGKEIGRGQKPFRLYFHRMEVFEGETKLGAIQRRFSILHRKFVIEDPTGKEVLSIHSPFFRIWTFKLLAEGQEVGRIAKRWGGILKEMFTDADVFGVEFSHPRLPVEVRKILLVAVFLIDFTCFENNAGRGAAFDAADLMSG